MKFKAFYIALVLALFVGHPASAQPAFDMDRFAAPDEFSGTSTNADDGDTPVDEQMKLPEDDFEKQKPVVDKSPDFNQYPDMIDKLTDPINDSQAKEMTGYYYGRRAQIYMAMKQPFDALPDFASAIKDNPCADAISDMTAAMSFPARADDYLNYVEARSLIYEEMKLKTKAIADATYVYSWQPSYHLRERIKRLSGHYPKATAGIQPRPGFVGLDTFTNYAPIGKDSSTDDTRIGENYFIDHPNCHAIGYDSFFRRTRACSLSWNPACSLSADPAC